MVRMTANPEEILMALKGAWSTLQRIAPDLPDVVVMAGGFRAPTIDPQISPPDVFVSTLTLSSGPTAALCALGHDAAHFLAEARGLNDTSNRGRYHNGTFAELAAELGFDYLDHSPSSRYGTANLRPIEEFLHQRARAGEPTKVDFRLNLRALAKVLPTDNPDIPIPRCRTQRTRRPEANKATAVCACEPPRIIYANRGTLDQAPIVCGRCESRFTIREADDV